MTDIKPIETRYAGCLFRSRLEARWAVFFDTLGIDWEYEAEGYECEPRCGLSGDKPFWYLPDFWLPGLKLHAEVKGSLNEQETRRLLDAAAYLSSPRGGCGGGHDMIVLGPVPRKESWGTPVPHRLHNHKGVLASYMWDRPERSGTCNGTYGGFIIATDGDESIYLSDFQGGHCLGDAARQMARFLIKGWDTTLSCPFIPGFEAARSARFEHGQSGAPQPGQTAAERREQLFESILRDREPHQFGGPGRWSR